jgi:Tol biopolymer transport system component
VGQQIGAERAIRVTRDGADDYDPSFSPDGLRIAFRSERETGGVWVVPVHGGDLQKIVSYGRRPRFSPDGKWIAYYTGSGNPGFVAPGSAKLYIVPSAGGSPRELCADFAAAAFPVWAPDSKHILFMGNRDPNLFFEPTANLLPANMALDWWVTPIDGGPAVAAGVVPALRAAGFSSLSQVPNAWMADGGVFISAKLADGTNLWRVPVSTKDWKLSGVPRRLTFGAGMDLQPVPGPGNQLIFSSLQETINIWGLSAEPNHARPAGELQRLTWDAVQHASPAVSMDGKQVAFTSQRPSGYPDVWLLDLITRRQVAITDTPAPDFAPFFSLDGTKLAYAAIEGRTRVAYTVDIRGGSPRKVREGCNSVTWSSDGERLLCRETPGQVSILHLASGRRTGLVDQSTYSIFNPIYSPDDRWFCFNATTANRSRIFVAPVLSEKPVAESEWIPITDDRWSDKPRWSPDGNMLYFISERDGFRCIWAHRLDPVRKYPLGGPVGVFHAHESRRSLMNVHWGNLTVSVALDKIVFNMSERTGNIWLAKLEPGSR